MSLSSGFYLQKPPLTEVMFPTLDQGSSSSCVEGHGGPVERHMHHDDWSMHLPISVLDVVVQS